MPRLLLILEDDGGQELDSTALEYAKHETNDALQDFAEFKALMEEMSGTDDGDDEGEVLDMEPEEEEIE